MTRLGVSLGPLDLGLFLVMLLAGLVIVYSFLLLLATCAFWFVKLENVLVIFQALFGNAGRWPVTIFPPWLRAFLTFVVPVAFAVTVPAQALTGQLEADLGPAGGRRRARLLRRLPGVLAGRPPPLHRRLRLTRPCATCSTSRHLIDVASPSQLARSSSTAPTAGERAVEPVDQRGGLEELGPDPADDLPTQVT